MKIKRIIYWIATGLLSVLMLFSAGMYFFNHAAVAESMVKLGYPTFLIYPHGLLKVLGIIAILSNRSALLKEWAYAGFFFDFLLAASSSFVAGIPGSEVAVVASILLIISRFLSDSVRGISQIWPGTAVEMSH